MKSACGERCVCRAIARYGSTGKDELPQKCQADYRKNAKQNTAKMPSKTSQKCQINLHN